MTTMKSFVAITMAAALVFAGAAAPTVYAAGKTERSEMQKMSMDQLPAPVKMALEKEAKGGTVGDVTMEKDSKGRTYYEAEIHSTKGKDRYVHVSEDGKVLKHESARKESRERVKETTKTQ
jgi:uncharacterized membrane protein YkoI